MVIVSAWFGNNNKPGIMIPKTMTKGYDMKKNRVLRHKLLSRSETMEKPKRLGNRPRGRETTGKYGRGRKHASRRCRNGTTGVRIKKEGRPVTGIIKKRGEAVPG